MRDREEFRKACDKAEKLYRDAAPHMRERAMCQTLETLYRGGFAALASLAECHKCMAEMIRMLRGAGNAIVPEVAAKFVKAHLEAEREVA